MFKLELLNDDMLSAPTVTMDVKASAWREDDLAILLDARNNTVKTVHMMSFYNYDGITGKVTDVVLMIQKERVKKITEINVLYND